MVMYVCMYKTVLAHYDPKLPVILATDAQWKVLAQDK